MSLRTDLIERLRALLFRAREERDLDEELRLHLDLETKKQIAAGLDPGEAGRRAHLRLGGMEGLKDEVRDARGTRSIEDFSRDIWYGCRGLRRRPGFTSVIVLSLALGIGANTAIFSLMDAVFWRTLPVPNPEGLWAIGEQFPYDGFRVLDQDRTVLDGAAASMRAPINVSIDGGVEPTAEGLLVSGKFFLLLGVAPVAGRAISAEDDSPSGHPVVMLSDAYWSRRFARDASAIGRVIAISATRFTIIGITPPEFTGVEVGTAPDLYVPVAMQPTVMPVLGNGPNAITGQFRVLARLQPGITAEQATAALEAPVLAWLTRELGSRVETVTRTAPTSARVRLEALNLWPGLTPAGNGFSDLREQISGPLGMLMAMVSILQLIACANTANLLLARTMSKQREFATRRALGAGQWRLMRQLIVESSLLAALGGTVGILLSVWATKALVAFISVGQAPIVLDLSPDLRVLAFTVSLSVLTGILFGIAPAMRATGLRLTVPPQGAVGVAGRRRGIGPDRLLVVVQIALSLVLLICAGLFTGSLAALNDRDTGFMREQVLIARIEPQGSNQRYRAPQNVQRLDRLYRDLLDRVQALPRVRSVSLAQFTPTNHTGLERQVKTPEGAMVDLHIPMIYPGYFQTMGIQIVSGRDLQARDLNADSPLVAIVNETFARQFYPGESPVGRPCLVNVSPSDQPCEIVGMVRDSAYADFTGEVVATIYQAFLQTAGNRGQMALHVRVAGDPSSMIPAIRNEIVLTDPSVPQLEVRTLADEIAGVTMRERLLATLTGGFGAVALLIASVGIYGLLAFAVVRRTAEIGVRVALGARRADIIWLVLREALVLVATGLAVGLGVGAALARVAGNQIAGLLYGLDAFDLPTMTFSVLVLVLVGTIAAYIPARRASTIDPMVALRVE